MRPMIPASSCPELELRLNQTLTLCRVIERALYGNDVWTFRCGDSEVPVEVITGPAGIGFVGELPDGLYGDVTLCVDGDAVLCRPATRGSLAWILRPLVNA